MSKRKSLTITGKDLLLERRRTAPHGEVGDEAVVSGENISVHDGYHSLREVYDHRMACFAALLNSRHRETQPGIKSDCWKSKHHSDCVIPEHPTADCMDGTPLGRGTHAPGVCCSMFPGFFVAGIGTEPGKQITYHLPLSMFEDLKVWELMKAPAYDGHTSKDVLERLKAL